MQPQASTLLLTSQESYPPDIDATSTGSTPLIQYGGSTAAMLLAIAVLIRAVTDLIRVLGYFTVQQANTNHTND